MEAALIRKLNTEQSRYFYDTLYPIQDKVLSLFEDELFYLTGGTCLSRFYYHHRFSEDLDFFYDGSLHPLYQFEIDFSRMIKKIQKLLSIEVTINSSNFKRVFCKSESANLKIEFIYEPYSRIGSAVKKNNYFIDTKDNIAVNKLTAIYTRKTAKDYFDLYFLLKEFALYELLEETKVKIIPPAYEELIIALKESIFEGEIITDQDYSLDDFKKFIESLILSILQYAKSKK